MLDFNQRFTVNNSSFSGVVANLDLATEEQLMQSDELVAMARMIRQYSILLADLSLKDTYRLITQSTDPELGLMLLSAKNVDGTNKFNETQVRLMLWSDTTAALAGFSSGLREVSCRLAASIQIVAFATQPYQLQTAEALRKQGTDSLDRIIQLQQTATAVTALTNTKLAVDAARFYFQPLDFVAADELKVSFLIPNFTAAADWVVATTYPSGSQISTRDLISDLAYSLNQYTLNPINKANVVAAVSQSGDQTYHYVDFGVRSQIAGFVSELITIRIEYTNLNNQLLPFVWGVQISDLKPYKINSQLLVLKNPKESTLTSLLSNTQNFGKTVIYFRPKAGALTFAGDITYRLSVSETLTHTATLVSTSAPRYSQAALALITSLHQYRGTSKLLGAIIRNDLGTALNPLAAVELIAWTATNPETKLIMDLLSVPEDIEIALGDENKPSTPFSDYPLTAIVSPNYQKNIAISAITSNSGTLSNEGAWLASIGSAHVGAASAAKEISRKLTGHNFG